MEEKQGLFSRIGQWGPFAAIAEHIRNKLLLAFLLVSLIPLAIAGIVAYTTAANALTIEAFNELDALHAVKGNQIEAWITDRKGDALFTTSLVVVKGTEGVNEGLPTLAQYKNDTSNPAYVEAFNRSNNVLSAFAEDISGSVYQDIMMVDPTGDVVFALDSRSVGTNVLETGEVSPELFQSGLQSLYVGDIRPNPVHEGELNFRIAAPVSDYNGTPSGVIILEAKTEVLNGIMQERTGMGESGETYLVGTDLLWRSDSRFVEESTILNSDYTVDTVGSRDATTGGSGIQVIDNYRGIPVLSSWGPLVVQEPTAADPDGVTWGILAEIDQAEVQQPVQQMALIIGGVVLAALVIVIITAIVVSGGLTKQVDKIAELFALVGMGDFDARAEVVSRDELGDMAFSLNAMLDNTLTLIQSNEDREQMQNSIMKLLEEIGGVADRDLTVEAEVTSDMTGAIADSFNMMIEQLREVISDVQDTTLQVSASANEVQATTEHLAIGSEEQAAQIVDTSAAIDEMAVSIQQVSENAALSATVGEQAVNNAQQGSNAVQETVEGMNRIREQVQETSKRIKRLGESSQEIGEIVQLISDIADRTSILALNASIQAAMAGEAGRGFAVVAEEVERLAERSTEATKQIDTLIRAIQNETYEAVAAMETMTNEVVAGSDLAHNAGTALEEIETVSSRLGELIQSISLASKQQARGSETIARSMNEIAEVTQQTAAGTKQAAVSISNLSILADDLRGSVSTFKLPGSNGSKGNGSDPSLN